jgi:hypothetical protein
LKPEKSSAKGRGSSSQNGARRDITHGMTFPQTDGGKLHLFRESDPFKEWWSLDEMRVCTQCGHLFLGRDIRISEDALGNLHFHCPTFGCESSWVDWEYPELHL